MMRFLNIGVKMLHMGSYLISQMHFFEVARMRSFKANFE